MKINKRVIGMIIGFTMVFGVGCNKGEKAEDLILENIENTVERNIEEYSDNSLLSTNQEICINWAKGIDFNKSKCEVKELENEYEIKLTLRAEYEYAIDNNDVYTLRIDKNDFKNMNLKDTDLLYNDKVKVVAIEGYCGNECISSYVGRKNDYKILDSDSLKNDMLFFLGDASKCN